MTMKDARKQLKKDKRRKCKLPDTEETRAREVEATRPKFSQHDLEAVLDNFVDYLDARRKELEGSLTAGVGFSTWDPYLIGYTTGMRAGLEMASDLVFSYLEWVRREIYHPEPTCPRK